MGRRKIEIAKLASVTQRNVTYTKRSKGLIKKAHEISVLCDVEVALIMFSCSSKLDHFSSQPGIWKILQRFVENIPDHERMLISQDNINTINELAEHPNEEEIDEEIIGDDIHQNLLQLTERMRHPSREAFRSQEQFAGLLQSLENIRQTVVDRRMQMQQVPEGWETGTSGSLQVQEHIEQQGGHYQEWMLQNITIEDPYFSSYAAMDFGTGEQNITGTQSLPVKIEPAVSIDVPEVVMDPLPEEYQEQKPVRRMDLSDGGVETADGQPSASIWWDKVYNATEES